MVLALACLSAASLLLAAENPTPVYIQSDYMERRPALNLVRFQGSVDIKRAESHIAADVVELNTETGEGTAEGHVRFDDPQHQITAERAEFNLFTRVGTLYEATGSVTGKSPARRGQAPQPLTFYLMAERVVRETEDRFRVRDGSLTTCVGPFPVWRFKAREASIETEGYAHLRHATFWIRNVPIFYTPYFVVPTSSERATGLLPPAFGTSGTLGFFLDNRFFWAINEQSDSTIGVDYLSRRGIRPSLEYRYVLSEADRGQFDALYLDDNVTGKQFWKVSGTSQQKLPGEVQGILTLDLVNRDNYDHTFELRNALLRTRREATSFLSFIRTWDSASLALLGQRTVDVANLADETLLRYPDVAMRYLPTPLPWGSLTFDLSSSVTNFRLDRVTTLGPDIDRRRFDVQPRLAWTYSQLPWFSVTPFVSLQETVFNEPRQSAEAQSVEVFGTEIRGPQFFRIYGDGETNRYKHIMEPRLVYTWIPTFAEKTRLQPLDLIDDVFPRNDMELSLTNRILARTQAGEIRELALLSISQGFDLTGQRGAQFTRIAPGPFFADLNVAATARLTSQLTLSGDAAYNYDQRRVDIANARLTVQPLSFLSLSLDRRFRRDPDIDFINGGLGLTLPKGWSLNYSTGFNARDKSFAGNALTANYRPQCWNASFALIQRPAETRVIFQIGLDAFIGPRLGF